MTDSNWDEFGWPADMPPVHRTDAPLWERALELMRRGTKRGRRTQRLRRERAITLRCA